MSLDSFEAILPYLPIVWVAVAVIFALIEALTLGLTTIWFAIGAVAAAITAALGGPIWLQIIVFFIVSIITLVLTRRIAIDKLRVGREKNNVEQAIGKKAVIIEDIAPFATGKAKLDSLEWSAVGCVPESEFKKGEEVEVVRIEGVKLIVKRYEKSESEETEC